MFLFSTRICWYCYHSGCFLPLFPFTFSLTLCSPLPLSRHRFSLEVIPPYISIYSPSSVRCPLVVLCSTFPESPSWQVTVEHRLTDLFSSSYMLMMTLQSGQGLTHCDAGGVGDWIAGDVWLFSYESVEQWRNGFRSWNHFATQWFISGWERAL